MDERLISIREVMTKERELPFDAWKLLFRAMFAVIGGGLTAAGVQLLVGDGFEESDEYLFAIAVLAIGALNVAAAIALNRATVVAALLGDALIVGYVLLVFSMSSIG